MSSAPDDIPILERPSFFNGQRLTASDLTEVQQFHQELRWLHNRSLHSWGIAFGYQVLGNRGDRKVQISAGYAIDCQGRDLILSEPMELAIPAVAGDSSGKPLSYYLTASYATDDRIPATTQVGACGTSGAVRRPERTLIRWQSPTETDLTSQFRQGADVILSAIKVQNCQLAEAASNKERRDAVPAQQPYISAGQTDPKQTTWRLYPDKTNPLAIVTTISTTSAGFRVTPRYQAHVVGQRQFQGTVTVGDPPVPEQHMFVVDGYVQIAAMTASKFDLIMFLPLGAAMGNVGSDFVTAADIIAILNTIAARTNLPFPALQYSLFALPLKVGQNYTVSDPFGDFGGGFGGFGGFAIVIGMVTIQSNDFDSALTAIAQRNSITVDALLDANGLKRETLSLQLNESLRIPGDSLPLNPGDVVLKESFLPVFKDQLNWSVVWTGVEG